MTDRDAALRQRRLPTPALRRVTTTELSIKGKVCCTAAAASANTLFVGTESALWIVTNGFVALLAGHQSRAGCKDGQGTEARFQRIRGLAQERTGGILVSDNHCLRRVSPHGQVTTVLGSGESGFADGKGAAARFNHPCGIVITVQGIIFVADALNHCIRLVRPAQAAQPGQRAADKAGVDVQVSEWEVETLCGRFPGLKDGRCAEACFDRPTGLALCSDRDKLSLIVADCGNCCIRKVALSDGLVTTLAGSTVGGGEGKGWKDAEATAARFNAPQAVCVDGNNAILVADTNNHCLRMIAGGRVTTLAPRQSTEVVAGKHNAGELTKNIPHSTPEAGKKDGVGPSVRFNMPMALAVDSQGVVAVADYGNEGCVRMVHAGLTPCAPVARTMTANDKMLLALRKDYRKLLDDTENADVTFFVAGVTFPAHRIILAARSDRFAHLLEKNHGKKDIPVPNVSAGAFKVLLRYLYAQELPEEEGCGEGLWPGEMAQTAFFFQMLDLYHHCVEQFKAGLLVGLNVCG